MPITEIPLGDRHEFILAQEPRLARVAGLPRGARRRGRKRPGRPSCRLETRAPA